MIDYYIKQPQQELQHLAELEKGCWINIYPPFDKADMKRLSEQLDIPIDFFIDSLDIDERSRYEDEDGVQLVVVNVPIENPKNDEYDAIYITAPIGIIEVDDYILTISGLKNEVVDHFLTKSVKTFGTHDHSSFVLHFFDRTVHYFLHFLKEMNNRRNLYERELYNSSRNSELSKLMNIQKSLVYFVTTLRDNEMMMLRIKRTDFMRIIEKNKEEQEDFLEDILIDNSQAQDMARIYTEILNSTMDAFASIISNNLNTIMKRLTSITIILMVPTLVASFYGMNVPLLGDHNPYAFVLILAFAIALSFLLVWFFMRNRLF